MANVGRALRTLTCAPPLEQHLPTPHGTPAQRAQRVPWLHRIALGALLAPCRSTDATRSRAWLLLALVGAASAHPIAPCVGDCSANASASRVTRRLTVTTVQPGVNLQTVVDNASPGDEIVLGDGTYTGSGTSANGNNMLYINKDITIRALNPGQAVLDGETARRVLYVQSGAVALEGLNITRGSATGVSGPRVEWR